MSNIKYKLLAKQSVITKYLKLLVFMSIFMGSLFTFATSQTTAQQGAVVALCKILRTVVNIIFLLGLTLMILGAVLYAGANIMPAQQRGGFQGYGMAMIIGGVVGVAVSLAAPYVLNTLVAAGTGTSAGIFGPAGQQASTTVMNECANAHINLP